MYKLLIHLIWINITLKIYNLIIYSIRIYNWLVYHCCILQRYCKVNVKSGNADMWLRLYLEIANKGYVVTMVSEKNQ